MNINELKSCIKTLIMGIYRDTEYDSSVHSPRKQFDDKKARMKAIKQIKEELLTQRYQKLRKLQSFFIHGSPGIGKSDMMRELAEELGEKLNLNFGFRDVRLTTLDPVDLRGLPSIDRDNHVANWLPAGFLPQEGEYDGGILLMDEINVVPASIQSSAYQLVLDKAVGEYILPDGWVVICAGNKQSDRAITHRLPTALANRFTHIELVVHNNTWIEWAQDTENDIDPFVLNFIRSGMGDRTRKKDKRAALFSFDPKSNDLAFATPRSWEFVSNLQYLRDTDLGKYISLVKGTVGERMGNLFYSFLMHRDSLPDPNDVLDGNPFNMPDEYDALYVMITMLNEAIKQNPTTERLNNYVNNFAMQLGGNRIDIAVLGLRDLSKILDVDMFTSSTELLRFFTENKIVFKS